MTTATVPTASNTTAPRERVAGTAGRLTFDGVLRGEWIKLLSLRSIRWSIATMLVLSWAGGALMAAAFAGTEYATPEAMPALLVQAASLGSTFTVLVMGVLGVLAVTSEYSSGLILSSLAAVPRRTPLLAAKAMVVAALALAVGALSIFGAAFLAALILGGGALGDLFDPAVLASLSGTVAYLVLAALLSLGLGALLRSSAGAISVVVTLLFISTIVFQILTMTGWEWVTAVGDWMPPMLGNAVAQAPLVPANAAGTAAGVGYWPALGGLAAWAAAALIPAFLLLKKRDAV